MRASVLEFGQAFSGCSDPALPPTSEHATCATREEADRPARQQAVESMRRATGSKPPPLLLGEQPHVGSNGRCSDHAPAKSA